MSILQANGAGLGGAGDPGGALAGGGILGSHAIDQSLRFNDDDTAFLKRDITTTSNAKTWTWSAWVKRSNLTRQFLFGDGRSSALSELEFQADGTLYAQIYDGTAGRYKISSRLFRDVGSWYHIVWRVDTTQATDADRNRVYINGEQITDWSSELHPNLDSDSTINVSGNDHVIGAYSTGSVTFDGYMAEVNFIDGTSLDPTSFGETINGVWVPKEYDTADGAYSTNGFYLPFAQDASSGSSTFFDRSGSSALTFTNTSHYDIGSSDDFTIEAFIRPTSTMMSTYSYLLGNYGGASGPYMMLQFSPSANLFYFYTGNGTGYQFDYTAGDVVAGQWHHIAVNRNSGNLRFFLDGVQKDSTQADSTAWNNNDFKIGMAPLHAFDGDISNVRMVVGSAVYADGATITVPTSTLTNVTNTQLLALTTSTITEDASSNGVTGTLSGSGYFSSTLSPFADFNFYDDTSGNGNNFTANNLAASDVVPDSPTNNFATLSPLHTVAGPTLSEGNLKLVGSGTDYDRSYATFGLTSGKWYAEFRYLSGDDRGMFGIVREDSTSTDASNVYIGSKANQYGLDFRARAYNNSSELFDTTDFSTGDIGLLCFDIDNGKLWFGRRDISGATTIWYDSAGANNGDPSAGTNPTYTGTFTGHTWFIGCHDYNGTNIHANFGADGSFSSGITSGGLSDANGFGDFNYIEDGFLALCSANLSEPTIGPNSAEQADDYFNTVLYTGNGTDDTAITGVGFQPDLVWVKTRSVTSTHILSDSVRGADKQLFSNLTNSEQTNTTKIKSFDADGFTLGTDASGTGSSNTNTVTYAGWSWKAGGTAVSNTDGSTTSSVSAAPDAGFSILTYTADAATGTVGHGLSSAPELVLAKPRNPSIITDWYVMHTGALTADQILNLNGTNAAFNPGNNHFNDTYPTDTVVSYGGYMGNPLTGDDKLMYCFHSVEGYSKVGSYVGNGSTDGTFVYTGFRPAFVLTKESTSTSGWNLRDNKRSPENVVNEALQADTSGSELTSGYDVDFLSNGFKLRTSLSDSNTSGQTYIYLAFAENPFKYANAR